MGLGTAVAAGAGAGADDEPDEDGAGEDDPVSATTGVAVAAGICCGAKLGTVGAAVGSADVPQATASTVNNIAATASQPARFSKASGWLVILSNS